MCANRRIFLIIIILFSSILNITLYEEKCLTVYVHMYNIYHWWFHAGKSRFDIKSISSSELRTITIQTIGQIKRIIKTREKSFFGFLTYARARRTDERMDGRKDTQTNRQTGSKKKRDGQMHRQTDRLTLIIIKMWYIR